MTEQRSIIALLNSADKTLYQCKEILRELIDLNDPPKDVPQPASTIDTIEALCQSVEDHANVLFSGLNTLHWRLGGGSDPDPREERWTKGTSHIPHCLEDAAKFVCDKAKARKG